MNFSDNKELFVEETQELLVTIENALLALEKAPDNPETVNEIFRGLHTIKGSGGMFGFSQISDFTHLVENLFDNVRQGQVAISAHIIDIGLRSIDCIAQLLVNPESTEGQQAIIQDIEAISRNRPSNPAPIKLDLQPLPQVWRISFKPQPQILLRGVHLEALFQELMDMGACHIMAISDQVPSLERLDPTAVYLSWVITLSTNASLAAIRTVFMFVEDYAELEIVPIELQSANGSPGTPILGEIMVNRGIIDKDEAEAIRQAQRPFGAVAVAIGLADQSQVEAALAEQSIVHITNLERETRQESTSIRVRKEKLDQLMDLVGEMVILQSILEQEAKKDTGTHFNTIAENFGRLVADLRDTSMSVRMVTLDELFSSFQRLVRDLSKHVGKELQLECTGGSTELDKNVIEALKDPLVHIIRNAADHGIESPEARQLAGKPKVGTISLAAHQVGNQVEITITDDGAGLDLPKIKSRAVSRKLLDANETDENRIMAMIFEPGFSTAEKTTGLSGRGVGMDVVKRNVERLRGEVHLQTLLGQNTTITLTIPLTLVIIEGLLVRIGNSDYVISLNQVQECVDITPDIQLGDGNESIINLRGTTIPVLSLRQTLGIKAAYAGESRLVIVENEGSVVGLSVDAVIGRKQVVIKPLSSAIRRIKAISGATILGDGSVALILDVAEIIKLKLQS